jgi:hypothetical protein
MPWQKVGRTNERAGERNDTAPAKLAPNCAVNASNVLEVNEGARKCSAIAVGCPGPGSHLVEISALDIRPAAHARNVCSSAAAANFVRWGKF